jgi:Flp pilus assembly protein TadG
MKRTLPKRKISRRNREQGIVIVLVAVFMLFVVGAMAALSIDVVTLYTARSEAQLAADSAALAAARVLANSGATSDTGATLGLMPQAQLLAQNVALQVAEQNQVGGAYLTAANVSAPVFGGNPPTNPTVTVSVQANLPTFFARIWGTKFVTVGASATAEAYNPSAPSLLSTGGGTPVAPLCVKPWLLPNLDPTSAVGGTIFNATTGAITNSALLGWSSITATPTPKPMTLACTGGNCSGALTPAAWSYFPGDPNTTFPPPTTALPTCTQISTLTPYQASVAGCIQTPISCNVNIANIDTINYSMRSSDTAYAVNCLTHDTTFGGGDTVTTTNPPTTPFQFVAGADNPVVLSGAMNAGTDITVSDSLVTVPVFDNSNGTVLATGNQLVGFVQLFLNPDSTPADPTSITGNVNTTIVNLAGCGTNATGQPILGNGASPVAVRLISPPTPP